MSLDSDRLRVHDDDDDDHDMVVIIHASSLVRRRARMEWRPRRRWY
jgi:hypothetical protein